MKFRDFLKNNNVVLDGGMGTLLESKGLKAGELPERWNITHSQIIEDIHKSYFENGSNVVCANTFGANSLKYGEDELENIIKSALENAKNAAERSSGGHKKFVALDIGPTGRLLKPLGDLDFEEAVSIFSKSVALGVKYGADLIFIETMSDSYETKAAILASKENSSLPILVCNAYSENGSLMTGATPSAMVALCEGMGVDGIGANCSFGPDRLCSVMDELLTNASIPVIFKPNAGLPCVCDGKTVFNIDADDFSSQVAQYVKKGVRVYGGCCGTTPEYISALNEKTKGLPVKEIKNKNFSIISSYTHSLKLGNTPVIIGERINPTGKKLIKEALKNADMSYILNECVKQEECGCHVLDVNCGLPEINEAEMLKTAVTSIQEVSSLPLQIDTSNIDAMEKAMRYYNGKPMVNSVNGKKESMEAVFPLIKKYGGVAVALTLDENGIPNTAEGRYAIAKKILDKAAEYGISKKDIVFDTLAMTVSADKNSARVTLDSLKMIKERLCANTCLGVSNVSYGLPNRDILNSVFFTMALENGLDCAIINPFSAEMMKAYYSFMTLNGMDENCLDYIEKSASFTSAQSVQKTEKTDSGYTPTLKNAIIRGFKAEAAHLTEALIKTKDPLDIVNEEIIPALDTVGRGYENKSVYLPQLLISAECAKASFEVIKGAFTSQKAESKGDIVIATVEGDIHDIGKNIVKLLLENYGFTVHDLGKDVPADVIVDKVVQTKAPILCLSALMTTTVPSMKKTIALLRKEAPECKAVVGGAVLNGEYAKIIGADKYAPDAMEAVRYAEKTMQSKK